MKLVGVVFLGFVASVVIGLLLEWVVLKVLPSIEGDDAYLWIPLLITLPIAFLLGSIVTGYFGYYEVENKWRLVWMAPALYCNLTFIFVAGLQFALDRFIDVNDARNSGSFWGLWMPFLVGLYWYLASLGGVGLGYFVRGRIVRWWYGD